MWKPHQLLEGKDFDPVFAHAIVRKFPELDDILWDKCAVERDEDYFIGTQTVYFHGLSLTYKGEIVAVLTRYGSYEKNFYSFIMSS